MRENFLTPFFAIYFTKLRQIKERKKCQEEMKAKKNFFLIPHSMFHSFVSTQQKHGKMTVSTYTILTKKKKYEKKFVTLF